MKVIELMMGKNALCSRPQYLTSGRPGAFTGVLFSFLFEAKVF